MVTLLDDIPRLRRPPTVHRGIELPGSRGLMPPSPRNPLHPGGSQQSPGLNEDRQGWLPFSPGSGNNFTMVRFSAADPDILYVSGDDGGLHRGERTSIGWSFTPFHRGIRYGMKVYDLVDAPAGEHPTYALAEWYMGPRPFTILLYRLDPDSETWIPEPLTTIIPLQPWMLQDPDWFAPKSGRQGLPLYESTFTPCGRMTVASSPGPSSLHIVALAGNIGPGYFGLPEDEGRISTRPDGRPVKLLFGLPGEGGALAWYFHAVLLDKVNAGLLPAFSKSSEATPSNRDCADANFTYRSGLGDIWWDRTPVHVGPLTWEYTFYLTVKFERVHCVTTAVQSVITVLYAATLTVDWLRHISGGQHPTFQLRKICYTRPFRPKSKPSDPPLDFPELARMKSREVDVSRHYQPEITGVSGYQHAGKTYVVLGLHTRVPAKDDQYQGPELVNAPAALPKSVLVSLENPSASPSITTEKLSTDWTQGDPLATPCASGGTLVPNFNWVACSETGTTVAGGESGDIWRRSKSQTWHRITYLREQMSPSPSVVFTPHVPVRAGAVSSDSFLWTVSDFPLEHSVAVGLRVNKDPGDGSSFVRFRVLAQPLAWDALLPWIAIFPITLDAGLDVHWTSKGLSCAAKATTDTVDTTSLSSTESSHVALNYLRGPRDADGFRWLYGRLPIGPILLAKFQGLSVRYRVVVDLTISDHAGDYVIKVRVGQRSLPSCLPPTWKPGDLPAPLLRFDHGSFEYLPSPDATSLLNAQKANLMAGVLTRSAGQTVAWRFVGQNLSLLPQKALYKLYPENMKHGLMWWSSFLSRSISLGCDRIAVDQHGRNGGPRVLVGGSNGCLYIQENEGEDFSPIGLDRFAPGVIGPTKGLPLWRTRGLELMFVNDFLPFRYKGLKRVLMSTDDGGLFLTDNPDDAEGARFAHVQPFVPRTSANPPPTEPWRIATECTYGAARVDVHTREATELFFGTKAGLTHCFGATGGVIVSRDGGGNWLPSGECGLPQGAVFGIVNALAPDKEESNTIYASVYSKGVFYLAPGETQWQPSGPFIDGTGQPLPSDRVLVTRLASGAGVVYAAVTTGGDPTSFQWSPGIDVNHDDDAAVDALIHDGKLAVEMRDTARHARMTLRHEQAGLYRLLVDEDGYPATEPGETGPRWRQLTGLRAPGAKANLPQVWRSIRDIAVSRDGRRVVVGAAAVSIPKLLLRQTEPLGGSTKIKDTPITTRFPSWEATSFPLLGLVVEGGVFAATLDSPAGDFLVAPVCVSPFPLSVALDGDSVVAGLGEHEGLGGGPLASACGTVSQVGYTLHHSTPYISITEAAEEQTDVIEGKRSDTGNIWIYNSTSDYFTGGCTDVAAYRSDALHPGPGLWHFGLGGSSWVLLTSLLGNGIRHAPRRFIRIVLVDQSLFVGLRGSGAYRLDVG